MIRMKPKKNKTFIPYDPLKAKGYAERVKALLVERGTINIDISQVCDEAKEDGCEPALIRYVARELMIDDDVRKERDEKRARYLRAVGLAVEAVKSGEMSARQAAKVYSIGKSSVYKEMAVREVSASREMVAADFEMQPSHNPETGEITETADAALRAEAPFGIPQIAGVIPPSVKPDPECREGSGTYSDDMPDQPAFLRRAGV
tara:strand:- start:4411 stop:5022 length:612 start_codon:yes stop_codon:yes gene_type:complete